MKIIVNPHKLEIEKSPVNEKEINITKCEFEFNDIEQDLVKKAFFTLKDTTYEQIIINGECDIPSEVLEEQGQIEIGVIAYQVENEEYIKRYNPSPAYFTTWKGSLKEAENSSKPTPSQIEQIESEIATIQNDIIDLDNNKQDTLVSGENIKTINNQDLLGSGNIDLNETYYTKEEIDNKGYINKDVDDLTNYTKTSELAGVALSGSYNDLSNTPDLSVYSLITETGNKINLEINPSTYVLVAKLYDKNNNLLSTSIGIDLPLETMVVGASYDSTTKEIVLVLKNGTEVRFSVADLVSGLQSEITNDNKLSSDLVDDTGHTNKFVTSSDITNWNNKIDQSALTDYVKNTDYATSSKGGVIKSGYYGLQVDSSNGKAYCDTYNYSNYGNLENQRFISKGTLENVITGKELTNKTYVDAENATQDTLIEELQEENNYLNSIIDQLPKVEGTGTDITLNNTIEGKLGIELNPSELEQFTTTGKNLFNINGTYTTFGCTASVSNNSLTQTNTSYYCRTAWLISNLTIGQTYTLKANFSNSNACSIELRILDSANNAQIETSGKDTSTSGSLTVTFIATETSHYIRIYSNTLNTTNTYSVTFSEIQLELGDSATSWEKYTNGASPNPSYPQQIHTISGDNQIVVSNKNLFDKLTITDNGKYLSNLGAKTNNSDWCLSDYISIQPNTSYITSGMASGTGANPSRCYYDKNKTFISGFKHNNSTNIIDTSPNNAYYMIESIKIADVDTIQIEKGSTATSYIEHKEQVKHINLGSLELCEIGDYKDEFYMPSGSNLFDKDNATDGYRLGSDGTPYADNTYVLSNYIEVEPSTQYSYSSGRTFGGSSAVCFYDSNKTFISRTTPITSSITTPNNAYYVRITDVLLAKDNIMLNKGSTALPYEPYNNGKWYLKKNIGKVVLDGSETWWFSNSATTPTNRSVIQSSNTIIFGSADYLSSYFIKGSTSSNRLVLTTPNTIYLSLEDTITGVISTDTNNEKRDKVKAWLGTHNTIVYYVLSTPTYTLLNDTLQDQINDIYYTMKSYKEQTNISQVNNDLEFTIKGSALLDLNTLIG